MLDLTEHKAAVPLSFSFLSFSFHTPRIPTGLTSEEMWWPPHGRVPLGLWLSFLAEADPEGMLPCDYGQQYVPRTAGEEERIERAIAAISQGPTAKEL